MLIKLARVIPEREAWLYDNKKALASVHRGLEQVRKHKIVKGPDMEKARRIAIKAKSPSSP